MSLTWVDILLIGILAITFVLGLIKGFMRQIIGILAVIVGLILAVKYYPVFSDVFSTVIQKKVLSDFLGFLVIFIAVLCIGWVISRVLLKAIRGPLRFFDRVLGGGVGLLKGVLICGILLFALLAFPISTASIKKSQIAPYCLNVTKLVVSLIPEDLKKAFNETYRNIMEQRGKNVRRV